MVRRLVLGSTASDKSYDKLQTLLSTATIHQELEI